VAVAQNARIEELRKKLEREPGSPLFAQYAEELRRAGELGEAIRVCREGLGKHPGYATARITLARALATSGEAAAARGEFEAVLAVAPDNVIARRGLEELGSDGARAWGEKTLSSAPSVAAPPAAKEVAGASAAEGRAAETGPIGTADAAVSGGGAAVDEAATTAAQPRAVSAEDEEYELEPLRPAAPSGPPQLTFRPLLDEDEGHTAVATSAGEARELGRVPAGVAAPEPPADTVKRPIEEKPAGVELASATLAELYFKQGSFERAAQVYEELLARDPDNGGLATRLREVRARLGARPAQAELGGREERLRRAIARLQALGSRFRSVARSGDRGADA
jgi:tetratricopeptide (TPR) repeat protein